MRINDLLEKDFYGMSQSLWHVTKTYLFSSIFEKRYFETSSLSDKDEMEAVIHALYPDVDINSEEFLNLVTEFEYDRYMSFSKRSNNDYAKLVIENAYPVNIEFHKAKLINDFNFIDIDYMKYRNKKEKMNRTEDATEYRLLTNQYRLYIYNSNYIKAIHIVLKILIEIKSII